MADSAHVVHFPYHHDEYSKLQGSNSNGSMPMRGPKLLVIGFSSAFGDVMRAEADAIRNKIDGLYPWVLAACRLYGWNVLVWDTPDQPNCRETCTYTCIEHLRQHGLQQPLTMDAWSESMKIPVNYVDVAATLFNLGVHHHPSLPLNQSGTNALLPHNPSFPARHRIFVC